VPRDAQLLVAVGDNVKGGSSVLARWPAEAGRSGSAGSASQASEEDLTPAAKRN
jgi:hypothetical protein